MKTSAKKEYEFILAPKTINFYPETLLEELVQNIITICTTAKFSVPMDRAFGIDADFIDDPVNSARSKLCGEIVRAVKTFEPRVRITSIDFTGDGEGKFYPRIKFRVIDA